MRDQANDFGWGHFVTGVGEGLAVRDQRTEVLFSGSLGKERNGRFFH